MTDEIVRMRAVVTGIERHCIPRQLIAECDQCGDQYLGGDVWNSQAENEELLLSDGWQALGNNVHICPSCSKTADKPPAAKCICGRNARRTGVPLGNRFERLAKWARR